MVDEEKKTKQEEKKEEIQKIREKEEKVIDDWKERIKQGEMIQRPAYFEMAHYINMVIKNLSYGVIITSRAGTGKTYTTLMSLKRTTSNMLTSDSYSTPSAFYIWLYKNRDKIKVIDDVHKMLESDKFSGFLKAVMWDVGGGIRKVSYNSTKNLEDLEVGIVPNDFIETGACIILCNKVNQKNVNVDAVLSRANYIKLEISNEEMLDNMQAVVNKPYRDLSKKERNEVYEFLKENFMQSTDLNLRTLIKAFNFYEYAKLQKEPELWKRLTMKLIKEDDSLIVLQKILDDSTYASEEERQREFERITGKKGRATYFRYKKKLGELKS